MYPVIFQTAPFTLKTAGIFLLIGGILMIQNYLKLIKRKKLNMSFVADNCWWIIIATVIGARIGYVLMEFSYYRKDFFQVFVLWDGNFDFFFGFFSFVGALLLLCKKNDESFWKWLDVTLLSILILLLFSSIGDFFSGHNYGSPPTFTFVPAISFDNQEIPYTSPLHPVQLYTALYILLVYFFMNRFFRIKRRDGLTALLCMMFYFLGDFLMEFLRGSPVSTLFGYRLPQILSFVIFFAAFVFMIIKTHNVGTIDGANESAKSTNVDESD